MKYTLYINGEPPLEGHIHTVNVKEAKRRKVRQNVIVMAWLIVVMAVPSDIFIHVSWLAGYLSMIVIMVISLTALTGRMNFFVVRLKLTSMMLFGNVEDYVLETYLDTVALRAKKIGNCSISTFIIERTSDDNAKPKSDETRKAAAIYHLTDMDTLNEIAMLCTNQSSNVSVIESLDKRIGEYDGALGKKK